MTADPLAVALAATLTELGPEADAWARDLRQALAAQGAYLVTAESLAAALLPTRWWAHGRSETENEWTTTELAAAILAALKVQP